MMHPLWIAGGAVVLALLLAGTGEVARQIILHDTTLTPDGTVSLDGENPADPVALARAAGLTLDVYGLGRMVESEVGGLPSIAAVAVAHAALNHAGRRSIADILLRSTGAGDGYFGRQAQGRYAATSRDPLPRSITAAKDAIEGRSQDPTDGARQWDSPQSYKDPQRAFEVEDSRIAAGNEKVLLPGVPERKLRFWRPA